MTPIPVLDAHTTAVVTRLTGAGILRVGDGQRPDGGGWVGGKEGVGEFLAYSIVYQLPAQLTGPIADLSAHLAGTWQVTSVSRDRHGASVMSDLVKAALLGATRPTVTGRYVWPVRYAGGGNVRREDSASGPPLFYVPDRFTIRSTPT